MPRIALVTYARLPALAVDEHALLDVLRACAIRAEPAVWDDPSVDWSSFDAVVIRSCWDYHLRYREFFDWVAHIEQLGVPCWNPPAVLRWNSRKEYLQTLAAAGVRTVPTTWVDAVAAANAASLADILRTSGWEHAVVKPVVSASAHDTWFLSLADAHADPTHDRRLRDVAGRFGAMVQPLVREIATNGEWSFVFFGGVFSHAVIKRAAAGDFRVQRVFGGSFELVTPPPRVLRQATAALDTAPDATLYARVDGVVIDGDLVLTELELLEPSLFLDATPEAPQRFAAAIANWGQSRIASVHRGPR